MKCSTCRKTEKELDTFWDTVRLWIFKHLFRNDYEDLKADSYTQGISDGYKIGFTAGREAEDREKAIRNEYIKLNQYAKEEVTNQG